MFNEEAVLFANDAFYLALTQGDFRAMEAIWAKETPVCCLHPGWEPLFGRDAVLESWRAIFQNPPDIRCLEPRVMALEAVATVVCYEAIDGAYLAATNQFVLEGGRILMFHHHAAPTRGRPNPDTVQEPTIN